VRVQPHHEHTLLLWRRLSQVPLVSVSPAECVVTNHQVTKQALLLVLVVCGCPVWSRDNFPAMCGTTIEDRML
jgi:hypothetical protein